MGRGNTRRASQPYELDLERIVNFLKISSLRHQKGIEQGARDGWKRLSIPNFDQLADISGFEELL